MNSRKAFIIDPTNLTPEQAALLDQFLREKVKAGQNSFKPNTTYLFTITKNGLDTAIEIKLTHKIVPRKVNIPDSNDVEMRYSVYDTANVLGSGNFGSALLVAGTLKHIRSGGVIFDSHKSRVIKEMETHRIPKDSHGKLDLSEFELSRKADHLHAKPEVSDDYNHYLLMKKFEGKELFDLINADTLNSDKKIKLSINLLLALKEQMHLKKIIHKDINPANILVNPTTLEVFIIDLTLSKEQNHSKTTRATGTPGYIPPEVISGNYRHEKSIDIFAMGITLALLWGYRFPTNDALQLLILKTRDFDQLFLDMPYRELEKPTIRLVLEEMTDNDSTQRPTTDQCVSDFNKVRLHRKTAHLSDKEVEEIWVAYEAAAETRNTIKTTIHSPSQLKQIIERSLLKISDTEGAVIEFVETLGIRLLIDANQKNDISAKLQEVVNKFEKNLTLLDGMLATLKPALLLTTDKSSQSSLIDLAKDIKYVINKFNKRLLRSDFDYVAELVNNPRTQAAIHELQQRQTSVLDAIKSPIPKNLLQQMSAILANLDPAQTHDDVMRKLAQLKMNLLFVIRDYFVKKPDKVTDEKRMSDIELIIQTIGTAKSSTGIIREIKDKIKSFDSPFTKSDLKIMLEDALQPFEDPVAAKTSAAPATRPSRK